MADTSTGENDIATKDKGYGTDVTQEFLGGEDSDETLPPAEELRYQFKATDGVSSHKANTFRTQELYQREVFQHSQRTYHPGLSASVEMRMAWSAYDLQKERQEAAKIKYPDLGIEYSLPTSPYDQWRKENPNEAGHYTWLGAFTKTQEAESKTTDVKSPEQERGTKRVHGHVAQDLPTNPDSEETQLRAEDEEENGSTVAAASEDDEDAYWTLPEADETEEMCARRIWLNYQRAGAVPIE
jgi:hypothetical protein